MINIDEKETSTVKIPVELNSEISLSSKGYVTKEDFRGRLKYSNQIIINLMDAQEKKLTSRIDNNESWLKGMKEKLYEHSDKLHLLFKCFLCLAIVELITLGILIITLFN